MQRKCPKGWWRNKRKKPWGLLDTVTNRWLGGDDGPKTYAAKEHAEFAARDVDARAMQPAGRTRAVRFVRGITRLTTQPAMLEQYSQSASDRVLQW